MIDTITNIVVQILNDRMVLVGAGFLINESMVLTCKHVVDDATSGGNNPPEQQSKAINIYIPSVNILCTAEEVFSDEKKDIAGLELSEAILEEKRNELFPSLLLAKVSGWRGRSVSVFGFPESVGEGGMGIWSPGIARGGQIENLMQMDPTTDAANLVERGFSGGPVVDTVSDQIVGMLTSYRETDRTAYFIPIDAISATWSELIGLVDEPENVITPFAAKSEELKKVENIFTTPRSFQNARSTLKEKGLLWVTGPFGIGKRTCAIKLATELGKKVYIIDAGTSWGEFESLNIQQSVLIFPDCLGKKRFERENLDVEWGKLSNLLKKENQNFLIFTSDDKVFDDAIHQTDLHEWSKNCLFELNERLYEPSGKGKTKKPLYEIYQNLLKYAEDQKQLTSSQLEWATILITGEITGGVDLKSSNELRQIFQRQMESAWRPTDIERFVNYLAGINRWQELATLLKQEAELEAQVHSWFVDLDRSSQVFLLVLSLLAGISLDEFWTRYREAVSKFHELDSSLAVLPLGLLRQRTVPYVSTNGVLDFVSPRAALAVTREVIRMYREYLLILVDPILRHWSQADINDKSPNIHDQIFAQEEIRRSIAETVGEALKYSEETSLIKLIEIWAQNYWQEISTAAAISLRQAQEEPERSTLIFNLLDKWLSDPSSAEDAYRRRWTVANTLWRIGLDFPDYRDMVLKRLQRLAGDKVDHVLDGTAQAVRNLVGIVPFNQLEPIYSRLARCRIDELMIKVRRQISFGLIKQSISDAGSDEVFKLINNWAHSNSTNIRWTSMYILIFGRQLAQKQRLLLFEGLHKENPDLTMDVFCLTLSSQNQKTRSSAFAAFKAFWKSGRANNEFKDNLAYISVNNLNSFIRIVQKITQSGTDEISVDKDAHTILHDVPVYIMGEILDQALTTSHLNTTILGECLGVANNYPIIQDAISIRASLDFHKLTNQFFLAVTDNDELRKKLESCCSQATDKAVRVIPVLIMHRILDELLVLDHVNTDRLFRYLDTSQSYPFINSALAIMADQNYGYLITSLAQAVEQNQQLTEALERCCNISDSHLLIELPRMIQIHNKQKTLNQILSNEIIDILTLRDILSDAQSMSVTSSALGNLMAESYETTLNSLGEAAQLDPEVFLQLELLCKQSPDEQVKTLPALVSNFNSEKSQALADQWSELIYRDISSFVKTVFACRQTGKLDFSEQTLLNISKPAKQSFTANIIQLMKINPAEKTLLDCISLTQDMEHTKIPKSAWFSKVINSASIAVFDSLGRIPLTEVRFGLLGLDPVILLCVLKNTYETNPASVSIFSEKIKEGILMAPFRFFLIKHLAQGFQHYPIDLDFLPYELRNEVTKAAGK